MGGSELGTWNVAQCALIPTVFIQVIASRAVWLGVFAWHNFHLNLNYDDEPGEDGVTPAGVVEAQHDVGGSGRHVGNENARKWCALR